MSPKVKINGLGQKERFYSLLLWQRRIKAWGWIPILCFAFLDLSESSPNIDLFTPYLLQKYFQKIQDQIPTHVLDIISHISTFRKSIKRFCFLGKGWTPSSHIFRKSILWYKTIYNLDLLTKHGKQDGRILLNLWNPEIFW